jgi:hypothetical protein
VSLAPQVVERGALGATLQRITGSVSRLGFVHATLLAVAGAYIAVFAGTSVLRGIYPYPIDGVEHGALQEVRRVLDGQPLYVAPTLDYVPMIYGPINFYLAAVLAVITGDDLLALRAVSVLASLGSIALLTLLVRRETGNLMAGLVGGALLGTCNQVVAGAMDVGRTDATGLLFALAAIYATRLATLEQSAAWRFSTCAGIGIGLAVLTKQSNAAVGVAVLLVLVMLRHNQVVPFLLGAGVTLAVALALLIWQSGSWPLYYLWQLPRQHQVLPELVSRFWDHVLSHFAVPVMGAPFYLVMQARRGDRKRVFFYTAVAVALIGMAWSSQATINGGANVELPAYAAFSLLFALSLNEALHLIGSGSSLVRDIRGYVLAAVIFQFAVMLYNPRLVVPYRSDMWDGQRLSATLAALPGPIFAGSYTGFLDQTSGAVAPDLGAVLEIQGERVRKGTPEGDNWSKELRQALNSRRFTYVIVDPNFDASMVTLLADQSGYVPLGSLFPPGDKYWEWRTGWSPKVDVWARPDLAGRPLN